MSYYLLTLSTQGIGEAFPQCIKMSPGYDLQGERSVWRLASYYNRLPDFEPNLQAFVLQSGAIATDVISNLFLNESIGLLLSEKLKTLLEDFHLPTHQFLPATVQNSEGQSAGTYFWLHLGESALNWLDWKQSTFMVETLQGRSVSLVELTSFEDFSTESHKLPMDQGIVIREIALKSTISREQDLFKLGLGDIGIYVSERLQKALQDADISGIRLHEADRITFV